MKKSFSQLILDFLGENVADSEYLNNGNAIALLLEDVETKINGVYWDDKLSHYLKFHNHKVKIIRNHGNFVTVYNIS